MAARRRDRTVVAISDLHCMHWSGITPPAWHTEAAKPQRLAWQQHAWAAYLALTQRFARPDLLIVAGDMISVTDPQWGAGEQVEGDPLAGRVMATQSIDKWQARKIVLARGTARHVTAGGLDVEDLIAEHLGAPIHDHGFVSINGHVIDFKHHILRTLTDSNVRNELLANREWHEAGVQPLAQTILRGHIHHGRMVDRLGCVCITLPGLQGPTSYGARRCRWPVHWGLAHATITPKGEATWRLLRDPITTQRQQAIAVY